MKERLPSTKGLIGRRIVSVDLDPETIEGRLMTSPRIFLDDGTVLSFGVQEAADGGEYGVSLNVVKPSKATPKGGAT